MEVIDNVGVESENIYVLMDVEEKLFVLYRLFSRLGFTFYHYERVDMGLMKDWAHLSWRCINLGLWPV